MGKTLGNHSTWLHEKEKGEVFTAPSMCEPVHNLSIEEILRDYTRGIVHSTRQVFYDEGEDIEEVDRLDDLSDVFETPLVTPDVIDPSEPKESDPAPQEGSPDPAPSE